MTSEIIWLIAITGIVLIGADALLYVITAFRRAFPPPAPSESATVPARAVKAEPAASSAGGFIARFPLLAVGVGLLLLGAAIAGLNFSFGL